MTPAGEAARLYRLATEAAMHWTGLVDQLAGGHLYPYPVEDITEDATGILAMMDSVRRRLASLACDPTPPTRGRGPLPPPPGRLAARQVEPPHGREEP